MVVQRSGECRVGRQYLGQVCISVCLAAWWSRGVGVRGWQAVPMPGKCKCVFGCMGVQWSGECRVGSTYAREVLVHIWLTVGP